MIAIANNVPIFKYFLYHPDRPITEADSEWCAPLPLARPGTVATTSSIRYGEYFSSIRSFLTADDGGGLLQALSVRLNHEITWADVGGIHICIQKHGAFYHPAQVTAFVGALSVSFVVNVAISPGGQAGLRQEFDNLNRLNHMFPRRYIPMAFHQGTGYAGENHCRIPMFLGEWLGGYHEFHVAAGEDKFQFIRVWNPEKSQLWSPEQKTLLYRRASEILTHYYRPETFEQIFPWHHGAGDFIVRFKNDDLDLRLITVRGYVPLIDADGTDPMAVLEAMLRFFLHLSLRMRIDRVDGTGDLVWLDETAVKGAISGFFDGLAQKSRINVFAESLVTAAAFYFSRLTLADLAEALEGIINAYPLRSPERRLMASHLTTHADVLFAQLRQHLALVCCL